MTCSLVGEFCLVIIYLYDTHRLTYSVADLLLSSSVASACV